MIALPALICISFSQLSSCVCIIIFRVHWNLVNIVCCNINEIEWRINLSFMITRGERAREQEIQVLDLDFHSWKKFCVSHNLVYSDFQHMPIMHFELCSLLQMVTYFMFTHCVINIIMSSLLYRTGAFCL